MNHCHSDIVSSRFSSHQRLPCMLSITHIGFVVASTILQPANLKEVLSSTAAWQCCAGTKFLQSKMSVAPLNSPMLSCLALQVKHTRTTVLKPGQGLLRRGQYAHVSDATNVPLLTYCAWLRLLLKMQAGGDSITTPGTASRSPTRLATALCCPRCRLG